jgi:hypothetical protein
MKTAHTPGPWTANQNWLQVPSDDGKHIRPIGNVESEANAAFIVRAVNNFEPMMKALQWAASSTHHPACTSLHKSYICNCAVGAASAALAAARGDN